MAINIDQIIGYAMQSRISDIHLMENEPPSFRLHGQLMRQEGLIVRQEDILALLNAKQTQQLHAGQDIDLATSFSGGRQRVNVYQAQELLACAIRLLNDYIPTIDELCLPPVLKQLAAEPRGLVLVTGPTGSGKSTTLAAMIDYIARQRQCHIITIEDPIEYVYRQSASLIHQREVGRDAESFASALRSALREDPDVILVGEMRDFETISAAITAAETGHLVFSTLHTTGAARTVDRIIDVFPPHAQAQIRSQLGGVLKGVITQQLLPLKADAGGTVPGRLAATEVMLGSDAILNRC